MFSFSHAHNSYLQFLAETGIVGLALLILFWILCFSIIFKAYKNAKGQFSKKVYLSSLGGIVGLFGLALTENYLSATTVMVCMSMATSLAIGLAWQEKYLKVKENGG